MNIYRAMLAVSLGFMVFVNYAESQDFHSSRKLEQPNYDLINAPKENYSLAWLLFGRGFVDKAEAIVAANLKQFPGDMSFRRLAFQIAFIQERYSDLSASLTVPPDILLGYPLLARQTDGWTFTGCWYIAHLNGIKTGRDPEALESEVLKEAWAKRESLPFGMVDEDGVHVDKQVLTLLLLRDSFGGGHRKLLFDRAAKLAPNDSFILEMKAKLLLDDGEEAKAVEMYKKALKAKASEARIKYLKKELVEAEKKAEYRKVIGPRTDRKGGG